MHRVLLSIAGLAVGVVALGHAQTATQPAAKPAPAKASTPDLLKDPTLYVVGYAHLDTEWRWTYQDTIRDFIPRTLNDNFRLFEKYPTYIFNFSGSRRYQMMREYYPESYEKLKSYVASGRWFPCGSSVDENDANVPSSESFVRHILYGNKFFRKEFGIASEEFMLPDCFGFPASLPSMLAHCGLKGFSTQKLTWGLAIEKIPFKVGFWEGTDGTGVTAALDPGAYVGKVTDNLANSNMWETRIKGTAEKSGVHADYHYFGTGDQGGAPDDNSVRMVEESVNTKGKIKVLSTNADQLFKDITPEMRKNLQSYKGELMLTEHSAGSVTSQAYMKRWNRKNEQLADAAERASVMASWLGARDYPGEKLEDAWYLVLGSQMHDILPGTSVPRAYDFAWNDELLAANEFGAVLKDAAGAVIAGLDTTGKGSSIVVYNPLSIEREDVVEAAIPAAAAPSGVAVTSASGPVPAQVLSFANGVARIAFVAKAGPVSFSTYNVDLAAPAAASSLKVETQQLENACYIVKLDANGDVSSIFDKAAKRELLSGPARLGLHYENPRNWPAWNQDWADRQLPTKSYAGNAKFKIVENGPARVAIEITRDAEGSVFTQRIRLSAGSPGANSAASRIEFDTDIDWRSRERSLRAEFPLSVANPNATYDLGVGAIERPNSHEKQFEYSFHQWLDLTDAKGDYGVSAMSDSKYGTDKPDDHTVRITLLHTPGVRGGYPDQASQDIGHHHVVYALYGHAGDWRTARSFDQGASLNQPLIAFQADAHAGPLGKSFSLMNSSDPNVHITAVKKAEESDEIIVRLRERTGKAATGVHVAMSRPIVSAREVDGQERQIGAAKVENGQLVADVHGYGLKAYALKLGPAPASLPKVKSMPAKLDFDTDVISSRAKLTDGSMSAEGRSYAAEAIKPSLTAEGVQFDLGPASDGAKNALAAKGQQIKVPDGAERVYILAASDGDVSSTITLDSSKPAAWNVQNWNGMIGQWDRRLWPEGYSEEKPGRAQIAGLEPGYVKQDQVAWYSSHHHTPTGTTIYEYSYIYKYAFDLPKGCKSVTLPNESKIKVFAVTFTSGGAAPATPARPLFDTLADHAQDAPRIVPAGGKFSDATDVRIEPPLYWREGAIRYTTDGSEPNAKSPVYTAGMTLSNTTTIKAAVLGADGKLGPVGSGTVEINDKTAPAVRKVQAGFRSPQVRVEFSEAVAASAADASHYTIEPKLAVSSVTLAADKRSAVLTLEKAPATGEKYQLQFSGIKDVSPNANEMSSTAVAFSTADAVYRLDTVTKEQMGTQIKNVAGLPVKGSDAWSINMYVRTATQPEDRTVIAGFGLIEHESEGQARYIAKFPRGAHFWSHNRDVSSRTPLDLNKWQMLTAVSDGSVVRLYKNGEKIGEQAMSLADDQPVINIAPKDPWDHKRQFTGEIRGFTIWNTALTDDALSVLKKDMPAE